MKKLNVSNLCYVKIINLQIKLSGKLNWGRIALFKCLKIFPSKGIFIKLKTENLLDCWASIKCEIEACFVAKDVISQT